MCLFNVQLSVLVAGVVFDVLQNVFCYKIFTANARKKFSIFIFA